MRYFENAKRAIDGDNPPFSNGSNIGPGFIIDDATTMEVERSRYAESRDDAVLWAQRKEFASMSETITLDTSREYVNMPNGPIRAWFEILDF